MAARIHDCPVGHLHSEQAESKKVIGIPVNLLLLVLDAFAEGRKVELQTQTLPSFAMERYASDVREREFLRMRCELDQFFREWRGITERSTGCQVGHVIK